MKMPCKFILTLNLILAAGFSMAQDSTLLSSNVNRSNIVVITKEGSSIEARVVEITIDYILLDAFQFNSPLKLSAYYIRQTGNYYKIEVEYLQAAIVRVKKNKGGSSTIGGALSGAALANKGNEDPIGNLGETGAYTAAGIGIGALVGTAKGMGRRKVTVPIYGKSENLIALSNYFQ